MTGKIYAADRGCWLSRANGWHNAYLVVDLAEDWGMPISENEAAILRAYRNNQAVDDPDHEEIFEAINDDADGLTARATNYLQSLTVAGVRFEWVDNDLWLRSDPSSPAGQGS